MLGGPINGVDTLPYGRTVRAVKGHGDLSPDGQMVVSWVIDQDWAPQPVTTVNLWQNSPFTESNRKSPIRFGMYPLSRVQPWCNATGTCP
jgi:hypothetical protein